MREVFHAAGARGQATLAASRQLSSLAVFDTWEGATAEARQHTNAAIRQDLDAHGNESLAVARAAGKAADGIEHVQSALGTLRHDATELRMTIDAIANKVVPSSTFDGPPMEALIAEMQLQPRLDAIVADANAADQELASAINMADGDGPIPPGPHDNRPQIQDALSKPLPVDPNQFNTLWNHLSPGRKGLALPPRPRASATTPGCRGILLTTWARTTTTGCTWPSSAAHPIRRRPDAAHPPPVDGRAQCRRRRALRTAIAIGRGQKTSRGLPGRGSET